MMRPTILLVEDEPNDRLILTAAFEKMAPELELKSVSDGEAAIAYLSDPDHPRPHVVLLDLKLPRKSGLEVLEWVRGAPGLEALPVTLLSSTGEGAALARATELGASAFVMKGVDFKSVRGLVKGIQDSVAASS